VRAVNIRPSRSVHKK